MDKFLRTKKLITKDICLLQRQTNLWHGSIQKLPTKNIPNQNPQNLEHDQMLTRSTASHNSTTHTCTLDLDHVSSFLYSRQSYISGWLKPTRKINFFSIIFWWCFKQFWILRFWYKFFSRNFFGDLFVLFGNFEQIS